MILRQRLRTEIETALRRAPICYLAGPRQVGKTTLARSFLPASSPDYFDLEDPLSLRLLEEPMTALAGRGNLVVIDEIQRLPGLFSVLRVLNEHGLSGAASQEGRHEHQGRQSLPVQGYPNLDEKTRQARCACLRIESLA